MLRRLGLEDAARSGEHDRNAEPFERRVHPLGVLGLAAEDGDVARTHRPPWARVLEFGAGGQQRAQVAGAVLGHEVAAGVDLHDVGLLGSLDPWVVPVDDSHPKGHGVGRAVEPSRAVPRADRAVGDPRVAELGAPEEARRGRRRDLGPSAS